MPRRRRPEGCPADGQALPRLLDMPELAQAAPHLAPEVLHRVVRRAGLERCVDLLLAATPEQVTAVLDLDLWGSPPSRLDEAFDDDRFGEWIESLLDRDPAAAADMIGRLDRSLVTTGLSRYVRVLDPGVLEPTASTDDEPVDVGLFATEGLTAEVGGYLVQARRADAWDAIVTLLVQLSTEAVEHFHAIMRGCRRLSDAGRESDGLDDLLDPPEQHRHEVAAARDDRRAKRGFTSTADARAFLSLARHRRSPAPPGNPIADALLPGRDGDSPGDAGPAIGSGTEPPQAPAYTGPLPRDPDPAEVLEEVTRVLTAEGLVPERPRPLLRAGPEGWRRAEGLAPLLEYVLERHPDLGRRRGQELAFLANTLVSGCRLQSRGFTPQEASDAALATCSFALGRLPVPPRADHLVRHDLVAVFEDGWAALHREVSLFVGEGLLAVLRRVRVGHSDALDGLHALRRSLEAHLAAGTPWLARDALDVLSMLDPPAWHGLLGLLSECPVIPDAVAAIAERRARRIDPSAFTFIATTAHVETIHTFMARLPGLLAA